MTSSRVFIFFKQHQSLKVAGTVCTSNESYNYEYVSGQLIVTLKTHSIFGSCKLITIQIHKKSQQTLKNVFDVHSFSKLIYSDQMPLCGL